MKEPNMKPLFNSAPVEVEAKPLPVVEEVTNPSVSQIRELLENGEDTGIIANRLGLDLKVVNKMTATVRTQSSTSIQLANEGTARDVLTTQLVNALDTIDIARDSYEGKPTAGHATAIATLIETVRNLVGDLEKHKSPDELVAKLDRDVIQPLVTELIKHLTNEMNKARNEISKNVDLSKQGIVAESIKQGLSGFGQYAKMSYDSSIDKLKKTMGVKL